MNAKTIPDDKKSQHLQYMDLEKWGWKDQPAEHSPLQWTYVEAALAADGLIDGDDLTWDPIQWTHSVAVTVDGKHYPANEADYENVFNIHCSTILAFDNHAPQGERLKAQGLTPDQVAPLSRWSDVVGLTWINACEDREEVQILGFIMQVEITSADSNTVIGNFMPGGKFANLPPWPGATFLVDAPEKENQKAFNTILGSPNGNGIAW